MKLSPFAPVCLAGLIVTSPALASPLDLLSDFQVDDICLPIAQDSGSTGFCAWTPGEALSFDGAKDAAGGDAMAGDLLAQRLAEEEPGSLSDDDLWINLVEGLALPPVDVPHDPNWAPTGTEAGPVIVDDVAPGIIDDASLATPATGNWG